MAVDIPVILHNGNSNDRSIAAASSSVNSSNNAFEKPYQPDQTYCFPKELFGKNLRPKPLFVTFASNITKMGT